MSTKTKTRKPHIRVLSPRPKAERNNVSTKRANAKNVVVMVHLLRNFMKLFQENKLEACIRILNNGSGKHSLAVEIVKSLWGKPVPEDFGKAWDCYPNTGYQKSYPKLHDLMGLGDQISYVVASGRAICRAKANGVLRPSKMHSVLRDVQSLIETLEDFTAKTKLR